MRLATRHPLQMMPSHVLPPAPPVHGHPTQLTNDLFSFDKHETSSAHSAEHCPIAGPTEDTMSSATSSILSTSRWGFVFIEALGICLIEGSQVWAKRQGHGRGQLSFKSWLLLILAVVLFVCLASFNHQLVARCRRD